MKAASALVALMIGGALLTGCGGGDDSKAAAAPKASASASPTPTPSEPAAPTATVQQYASVIARSGSLSRQIEKMEDCDWLGDGPLDEPGGLTCSLGVLTMSYQASTLGTSLKLAQKPSAEGYVGDPPAEVAPLVAETTKVAGRLEKTAQAASDGNCAQTSAGRCARLRGQTASDMDDMRDTLAAWSPYL